MCGESAEEPGECPHDKSELQDVLGDEFLGLQLGPYRIARLLGAGGMGRVYLAVHPEIGSRVAIKIFSRDCDTRVDLVERFFAEARATNLIGHEHIINVLDVNRLESGRPYMVMEHLRGLPLSKLIGSETLTDSGIVQIMLDVLDGLHAAHGHKIIHRDLKPDNIFVSPGGKATLLDFGVAKLVPEMMGDSGPTTTGAILGTPHYMSPEQAVGDPIDERTDIYALGVILFECFTGRRPFRATSLYKLLDQHVHEEPPKPRSYRAEIGADVEKVILRALSKLPKDRHQSAAEMRQELEACASTNGPSPSQSMRIRIDAAEVASNELKLRKQNVARAGKAAEEDEKGSLGQTASTVAPGPKKKPGLLRDLVGAKQKKRLDMLLRGGSVLGILAVLGYYALRDDDTVVGTATEWGGVAGDASPQDQSATEVTQVMPVMDAGQAAAIEPVVVPDASVDAAMPDAAPVVVKPKGIAPLSLYNKAYRLAVSQQSDVSLEAIGISGLTTEGRVILRESDSKIVFTFHSKVLTHRAARRLNGDRLPGACRVMVIFKKSRKPTVERRMAQKCAEIATVSRPFCTMAELFEQKGKSLTKHFRPNSRISAHYSAREFNFSSSQGWQLGVDNKKFVRSHACK